jgi:hypothetical protein
MDASRFGSAYEGIASKHRLVNQSIFCCPLEVDSGRCTPAVRTASTASPSPLHLRRSEMTETEVR